MEGVEPRGGEAPPEDLLRWLGERLSIRPPLTLHRFKGGQSNPTYLARDAGRLEVVLRRKPLGELLASAHQIEREYRILQALAPTGLPVPRVFGLCDDPSIFGAPFYAMEFVRGRTFWDQRMPGESPARRRAAYSAAVDTLARLHALDFEALGLGDLGPREGYVARQIARWTRQYRLSEDRRIDAMEDVIAWIAAHAPDSGATALIHGDYRLDNLIFEPQRMRIAAILDWEICTIGDPIADLAFLLYPYWLPPHLLNGIDRPDRADLGIPSETEQIVRYERASGCAVGDMWPLYRIYTLFRLAAIMQGIEARVRSGTAANPKAARLCGMCEPLARLALDHIDRWKAHAAY